MLEINNYCWYCKLMLIQRNNGGLQHWWPVFDDHSMFRKFETFTWTKIIKKSTFLEGIFISSSEKLTFEKENVIFLNTF